MLAASFVSANPIPIRGIVEGFYGAPWTHQQRLDCINFAAAHHFNAYIYAPKDDPYHRAKWREPYPDDQLQSIKELVDASARSGIEFIFAVSPGLDLKYTDDDVQAMINKLDAVKALGCQRFAIFFDDIDDHNATAQADFINRIEKNFVESNGLKPLITVPTEYYLDNMIDNGATKKYTADFAAALDKNILVLFTGSGVVVPALEPSTVYAVNKIYDRSVGLWWNYPVNDYLQSKLALGPIDGISSDASKNLSAIFFNPMSAWELSKISLTTAGDFSFEPSNYEAQKSWERALDEQFGALSTEMKLFAAHSQHMQNDWANCGRVDAQKLRAEFDMLLDGEDRADVINKILVETTDAVNRLKIDLPSKVLNECHEQLDQLERLMEADQIALEIVRYERRGAPTDQLRQILQGKLWSIDQNWEKAMLSEDCAYQFIKTVLER